MGFLARRVGHGVVQAIDLQAVYPVQDIRNATCHRILLDVASLGRPGRVAFVGRSMRRRDAIVIRLNTMRNRDVFKAVFSERLVVDAP